MCLFFSPPIILHSVTLPRNVRTILYSVYLPPPHEIHRKIPLSALIPPCTLLPTLKTAVKIPLTDQQPMHNWLAVFMPLRWIRQHILPTSCSLRTMTLVQPRWLSSNRPSWFVESFGPSFPFSFSFAGVILDLRSYVGSFPVSSDLLWWFPH